MIQLDYRSSVPIYDQLINGIIRLKMVGAIKGGDSLPSVRALASQLGINPNTVQKAYAILEEKGIIYSVSGKGSFLSEDEKSDRAVMEISLGRFKEAVEEAHKRGISREALISAIDEMYKEESK